MKTVLKILAAGLILGCAFTVTRQGSRQHRVVIPGTTVAPGAFLVTTNGLVPVADTSQFWPGVWVETTNNWRVQVYVTCDGTRDAYVTCSIGSVATNCGDLLSYGPGGARFSKLELRLPGGASRSAQPPYAAPGRFPEKVRLRDMPTWADGALKGRLGFRSNTPPAVLSEFLLADAFPGLAPGTYTLLACPVVYEFDALRREARLVPLPCVAAVVKSGTLPAKQPR